MKKITILLYITLACCLLACERQITSLLPPCENNDCISDDPRWIEIEDPPIGPFHPPQVVLYPNNTLLSVECVYETVDMPIGGVEAFNSKTTSEVILKIRGDHHNGCVSPDLAFYEQDGNTITVWATKHVGVECVCTDAVVPIGMAIYIGPLGAGEYKVVSQSGEQLLTFHTDNLENMTFNDCYPPGHHLPQIVPPDVEPGDCPR